MDLNDLMIDDEIRKTEQEVNFKLKLRMKRLVPIIRDESYFIYRIKSTNETQKIINSCVDNLSDIYEIVTNDKKIKNDFYFRRSYSPYFNNLFSYRVSSKDDLYKYYNLDDDNKVYDFFRLPQNLFFDVHEYTSYVDAMDALADYYFTFVFKRPSKIAETILYASRYFDIDYIASSIYNFMCFDSKKFSTGTNPIGDGQIKLDMMNFSNIEMNMSEDDKILLIKDIINSFEVEFLYSVKIDEMSDFIASSIFGTNSKEMIYDFSKHNTNLIYNSDFSSLFQKIMSTTTLKKVKQ